MKDREEFSQKRRLRKLELLSRLSPRPGIRGYLRDAKRLGLVRAIVSTDDMNWITSGLRIIGLDSEWDFIECAEGDRERAKPRPALYHKALERASVVPDEAVAFEDSPNGIRAAKSAGVFCVALPNDVTRQMDLSLADLAVEDLSREPLPALLTRIQRMRGLSREG